MLEALVLNMAVPVEPALIADLPTHDVTLDFHGETQVCTGPLLADVMARIGAPAGGDVRGEALLLAVVVEARDGYNVAFTLGELDPLLGKAQVVLAAMARCLAKWMARFAWQLGAIRGAQGRSGRWPVCGWSAYPDKAFLRSTYGAKCQSRAIFGSKSLQSELTF